MLRGDPIPPQHCPQAAAVRLLQRRQRQAERPAAQAKLLHGGLDRDGVHDAEQRLAQRQKLQLAARTFAEISGKAGIRHGNDGLRRDVRHHGDHAAAAERHDRGRLVVVAAPNR